MRLVFRITTAQKTYVHKNKESLDNFQRKKREVNEKLHSTTENDNKYMQS